MSDKYILLGRTPVPCDDLNLWGRFFQDKEARRVASTRIGGIHISTVFIGLDHSFEGGPPILFETMVFGGPLNEEQDRYCTWEEAEAGHGRMVARVRETKESK